MTLKSFLKYLPNSPYFTIRRLCNRYMSARVFYRFFDWYPDDTPPCLMLHFDESNPHNVYIDPEGTYRARIGDPVGLIKGVSSEFDLIAPSGHEPTLEKMTYQK